ncbi:hypothetical protein D3C78_663040 [compost metagenome]
MQAPAEGQHVARVEVVAIAVHQEVVGDGQALLGSAQELAHVDQVQVVELVLVFE